jgi:Zn-dependent protease
MLTFSFLASAIVAIVLHELSHVVMAVTLGVKVKRVGLSWRGPYVVRECGTPAENVAISLAGPVANLLTVFACLLAGRGVELCLASLVLGVFNLLPVPSSDGLRAARLLWTMVTTAPVEKTGGALAGL